MFKTFYYYYYLFYTKVIPDDEPHATTLYTLSFTEAMYFVVIAEVLYINYYCEIIPLWGLGLIFASVLTKNYIYFYRINDRKQIIKSDKNPLRMFLTIAFFLIGISLLFWLPFYGRDFLSNC